MDKWNNLSNLDVIIGVFHNLIAHLEADAAANEVPQED
jgi:hypothetical protein